ncbi:MAG: anthranilate synthase component I [Planctomycetota bacterium]
MLEFLPPIHDLAALPADVNSVAVYCSLLSDELTPVSAFERLAAGSTNAFLLESVVGGEKIARYSFLAADPAMIVESAGARVRIRKGTEIIPCEGTDPLEEVRRLLSQFRTTSSSPLPRFTGGAVGYAGYDVSRCYEKLGTPPKDDRFLPDLHFGLYDHMVIFDHVRKIAHLVAYAHKTDTVDWREAYQQACSRIQDMAFCLSGQRKDELRPVPMRIPTEVSWESSFAREGYEQAVERCKNYIRAGDAFQVVLSQRLTTETSASPFDVYRALRVINPSPFMFYLQTPSVVLVGSSPEVLCRIEGQTVSTRPLAGTRPRGRTEAEDRGLEAELLADPKERAEHIMLVDLGRNDLGRVCEPGTVRVDDLMSVERYSHVMHLCSNVSGTMAADKTSFDALRSVLPVGTVSGAPKIRAMQIIDELEPVRRGPYAGAVGYIDFAGNMDTCIALRTLVICPAGDGRWRVDAQVGAGIVADSEPAKEYEETLNKAKAMLSAIAMANAWTESRS